MSKSRYYHDENHHPKSRFLRNLRRVVLAFIALIVIFIAILIADTWLESRQANTPSERSQETTVTYNSSIEVQQTAYFQFQANKSWNFMVNESNDTKYVYRSFRENLVEHEVTILINEEQPLKASRVLPVEYIVDGRVSPGFTSDHCSKILPARAAKEPQMASYQDTKFFCDYHSNEYTVIAGARDGDTSIQLLRPNGAKAGYTIFYRNLTATPEDAQMKQIVGSFQAR